jgi:hypothetical protein
MPYQIGFGSVQRANLQQKLGEAQSKPSFIRFFCISITDDCDECFNTILDFGLGILD